MPLGFLGCILGTLLSKEEVAERTFDELHVRAETGLGAEKGTVKPGPRVRPKARVAATAAISSQLKG